MRQNRCPGERLFVDYAGMTVLLFLDGVEHKAQVFVASMDVSGQIYAEAGLIRNIDDWCNSNLQLNDALTRRHFRRHAQCTDLPQTLPNGRHGTSPHSRH